MVEVEDALPGTAGHACPGGDVGSGIQQRAGLDGGDAAVGLEPGAYVYLRGVAHPPGDELILPRILDAYRPPRALGKHSSNSRQPGLVFVAVARAEEGADHPDAVRRQPQCSGQRVAVDVDAAGGLPDGEVCLSVFAP